MGVVYVSLVQRTHSSLAGAAHSSMPGLTTFSNCFILLPKTWTVKTRNTHASISDRMDHAINMKKYIVVCVLVLHSFGMLNGKALVLAMKA